MKMKRWITTWAKVMVNKGLMKMKVDEGKGSKISFRMMPFMLNVDLTDAMVPSERKRWGWEEDEDEDEDERMRMKFWVCV